MFSFSLKIFYYLVSLDSNDYAEVEFHQTQHFIPSMDYLGFGQCKPMRLLPKFIINQQLKARTNRALASSVMKSTNSFNQNDDLEDTTLNNPDITSTKLKRSCNVDVDPKQISDRYEWGTAQYHSYYNPHCLFELEIHWLVATSCILGDLITNWSQRTGTKLGPNRVVFHLVPIPCDPFAKFDPLRGIIKIFRLTMNVFMLFLKKKTKFDIN